ncbi:MAG TPA: protein kinase, partial [Isosphaeraceae bacterium]|nr:protein kinase [Isosphaeraceae bacterium]
EESRTPSPPPASTLPPGLAEHPDYQVLRELGRGGMGVVYLAENRMMGRKEVLKVVSSHLLNRKGVLERFLREIRSAAQLHHPNIVTAYSATRGGESIVFSMQYVEGYDLAKLVEKSGPLSVAHACNFVYQAALGLQHAHEHGMVHRDIKPGNLMLARQGNRAVVKVLDFGLAKVSREVPADGTLTYEGQMLGTPDFIAPEQSIDARKADIRADIYSLGCTLYYLLTGGPPFQGTSLYDILQAHHSRDALPLNLARPEVPVELAALVGKMMAKEPERRFQTPAEVAEALKPFFRKDGVNSKGLKPEMSQVGLVDPKQEPTEVRTSATQPKTGASAPPGSRAAGSSKEPIWESLIDIKETEDAEDVVAAVSQPKRRWPRWFWPAIAAAFSFALIAMGVIIYVATDYGRIKIIVDGPNAEVRVDGEEILIRTPRESITLRAGKHELTVKWHDGKFETRNVVVHRGKDEELRVEYEPKHSPDKPPAPPVESINRTITDSMLVIKTNNRNIMDNAKESFPVQVDSNIKATLRSDKIYINEVFGRKNVLCTMPLSPSSPGTMDFSRITKDRTGTLTLLVHGYPGPMPGGRIVVKLDGVMINDVIVNFGDGWKKIVVPFRQNEIVVEHHALGWNMEFLFVDYWIVGDSTAMTNGMEGVPTGRTDEGSPGHQAPKTITNSIGMTLKLIPAGEFLMGSPDNDSDAASDQKPQHRVRISKPFYLGVCEVTQAQ